MSTQRDRILPMRSTVRGQVEESRWYWNGPYNLSVGVLLRYTGDETPEKVSLAPGLARPLPFLKVVPTSPDIPAHVSRTKPAQTYWDHRIEFFEDFSDHADYEEIFHWLEALPGKPVFVGYPASYDFLFVYWYLVRFTGHSPFSFSALDIKTYAMAMLGTEYRQSVKRNMPKRWFDETPHSHVALDDAIEQGLLFCNMLAECRR